MALPWFNLSWQQRGANSGVAVPMTRRASVFRNSPVVGYWSATMLCALVLTGCSGSGNRQGDTEGGSLSSDQQAQISLEATEQNNQAIARGQELLDQGALDLALAEFELAIENNPTLTVAYLRAGDIHRQQGDFTAAERRYGEAAQIEPRNFDAQYLHGLSLQLLQRLDESVRAYLRALAIRPDDFFANLNLGTTFLQLGEPEQGLPYALRATQIRPTDGPARVNLGATFAAMDRHAEAVSEYEAASELMTLGPELLLNLAESQGQLGRYAEMEGTLRRVVQVEPSAVAWERLGSAQFRGRRYQEALESFRSAIAVDPNHYPAHNGVGVCLLNRYLWSGRTDTGALDSAISSLRSSLRIQRDQPRILELVTRYGR